MRKLLVVLAVTALMALTVVGSASAAFTWVDSVRPVSPMGGSTGWG
jgi:hypothetical protein